MHSSSTTIEVTSLLSAADGISNPRTTALVLSRIRLLFFISLKLSEDTAKGTKGPFLRNIYVSIIPFMHLGSSTKLKLIRTDA